MTEYEENMLQIASAQYIQLCRIYDYLTVIAEKLGIDSISLRDLHEQGKTFAPDPLLVEEEENDQNIS